MLLRCTHVAAGSGVDRRGNRGFDGQNEGRNPANKTLQEIARSNIVSHSMISKVGSMTDRTILGLVKFFSEEEYADRFIGGELHLKRLSYFQNIESECEDGRADENEAVAMWWQPNDILIKLSVPNLGLETEITEKDLAAPISVGSERHNNWHVFCMYAIYTTGYKFVNGKIEGDENDLLELNRQIVVDEQCLKFGKYAVFISGRPFLERLKQEMHRKGYQHKWKLVEYYDDRAFNGEIEEREIPFRKQLQFRYQKEFRICVDTKTVGDAALTIKLGDISHICKKVNSSCLKGELKFLEAPPETDHNKRV